MRIRDPIVGSDVERLPVPVGFFNRMKGSQRLSLTLDWLGYGVRQLLKVPRRSKPRFVILTPPLLSRQVVFDRRTRSVIHLQLRDAIDVAVMQQIFETNDYGFERLSRGAELAARYDSLVAAGLTPLIVDCGANSGMASRFFSVTYPAARIIAIEPDAENLAFARLNNPGSAVRFKLAGVGHSEGRARIVDTEQGNWAYRTEERADGPVEIISINRVLEEHCEEGVEPFLIKIDIEGYETNLFAKNTEWIDRFPVLVIELHDWLLPGTANSGPFLREISQRDRDFVYHGENVVSIANTPGLPDTKRCGSR
jgi:FkbM family methyltransferase